MGVQTKKVYDAGVIQVEYMFDTLPRRFEKGAGKDGIIICNLLLLGLHVYL